MGIAGREKAICHWVGRILLNGELELRHCLIEASL
jgi:hypothetical protein